MKLKKQLLTLCLLIMLTPLLIACSRNNPQLASQIKQFKNDGYQVSQDATQSKDYSYTLTKEAVTITLHEKKGELQLDNISKLVSPLNDLDAADNQGTITLTPKSDSYVEVTLENTVTQNFDNGNSMDVNEVIRVVCTDDFSDSFDPDDSVTKLGKASKNYNEIVSNWMTKESLQELYQQGLTCIE